MAQGKQKANHIVARDDVGDVVAYSPFWQNGAQLLVLVEFDTGAEQQNFLNGTAVYIEYVESQTGKRSLWPRAMNIAASHQAPFTVSVSFTAIDPNTISSDPVGIQRALRGTGSGTIVYTDAIGPHKISGSLTLINLTSISQVQFERIFNFEYE